MVVNTALIVLKLRPGEPAGGFEVPVFVPALGVLINVTLIFAAADGALRSVTASAIAGIIVAWITAIYFLIRPKDVSEEVLATIEQET